MDCKRFNFNVHIHIHFSSATIWNHFNSQSLALTYTLQTQPAVFFPKQMTFIPFFPSMAYPTYFASQFLSFPRHTKNKIKAKNEKRNTRTRALWSLHGLFVFEPKGLSLFLSLSRYPPCFQRCSAPKTIRMSIHTNTHTFILFLPFVWLLILLPIKKKEKYKAKAHAKWKQNSQAKFFKNQSRF